MTLRTAYATPEMVALNRVDLNEAAAKYKGDALMTDLVEQAAKFRPGGRATSSFPSGINIGASFGSDHSRDNRPCGRTGIA